MVLSVIIVSWNTKALLLQCLESLCTALGTLEAEVFVVDNGSADGSPEAVKRAFPAVRVIENRTNLGFAKASNQALRQSQGTYLLLLNPDTHVNGGAIQNLLSFLAGHPEAGMAGAQLLNPDGSKQNSIANFPSLATELLNKSLLRWFFPETFPGKERTYEGPLEVDSVIGACMMVRREAAERVGWFDEDYFLFLEETDWCFRMKRAGWKIFYCPEARIYHFQGKSAELEKGRAKVEYHRSRYLFFRKNRGKGPWMVLHVGVFLKLVAEVLSLGLFVLLTFFSRRRWRRKFLIAFYLLTWHLRLCPQTMGLKGAEGEG
jgi:GT2 family glycosyltransferase